MIGDAETGPASFANYLGLIIDFSVNIIEQIDKVSSKLSCSVCLLRRLSCFRNPELLIYALLLCSYSLCHIQCLYGAMIALRLIN